ncbi:C6 transcription factor, putative [Talaromyces stipitatus ATCC 10500]|uniref:C6 transcription factor, putative n=1 Tax=Talaromyces stipitatus (strain ATCC 10500 / CBS 375.48 / QM 6759 / NRRL 1006) TaxID=441959 RepID=B8M2X6_TALSN|nr:C6 transcription factor, putative [Talaromyces stipitatus ATCC 10500]EED22231.1 C6 transcription factor, putative [Talaromyces stipitatus ATCC 10500]
MELLRASFAIWTTSETKISKLEPQDAVPTAKDDVKKPNGEENKTKPQDAVPIAKDDVKEPDGEGKKSSRADTIVTKVNVEEPHVEDEESVGTASTVKGDSPSFSFEASPSKENRKKKLPLSMANLIRITESEQQQLLSDVRNSFRLSNQEMREIILVKNVKDWLRKANPDGRQEDTASESFRSGDGEIQGGTEISVEEIVQQQTDAASSNPYIMERNLRVDAAKERISILQCRNGIEPGVCMFLRHAMHTDAEDIAAVFNSYVNCSAHTLESTMINAGDVIQRINESRYKELPFIVAIKKHEDRLDIHRSWGRVLGYVRLTDFQGGLPAFAGTAQLEITVAHDSKGVKVGSCLLDAMMTMADPQYIPRGGYAFVSNIPNETMIHCASWSCRPLTRIVLMMSYLMFEQGENSVIENWLTRRYNFQRRGFLPAIAIKMGQEAGITILICDIARPSLPYAGVHERNRINPQSAAWRMTSGDSSTPPSALSGHMRQRSRYACGPCRHRKRKCDGKFPCSTCTGYGYECNYSRAGGVQPETNTTNISGSAVQTSSQTGPVSAKRRSSATGLDEDEASVSSATRRKSKPALGSRGFGDEIASLNKDRKPPAPNTNGLMLPSKCRYIGQHSSVAFPQWLGKSLQSRSPPRVHSFGYNTGIRNELPYSVSTHIQELITWTEAHDSLDVYATVIDPVFGFVDMEDLRRKSHDHWNGKDQGSYFEALISGVIGLASLFSKVLCEGRELKVIRHAKDILDDPFTARYPRLATIQAWVLRVIYIRSTSRPGTAWLYSCIMMHLCEAIGVYREREADEVTDENYSLAGFRDICARVMMVARCLHIIISYEHGRSTVDVGPVLEHNIVKRGTEDLTLQLHALVNNIPADNTRQDHPTRRQELSIALTTLISIPISHEFFNLIKADLCFCIYRRLRLLDLGIKQEQLTQIIQAGKTALPASRILILRNHPWWNTLGTVFQFICVLLAIDSSESLATIPEAMETLTTIAKHLKTHLADEALGTARLLVRSMTDKKRREAAILDKTTNPDSYSAHSTTTNGPDAEARPSASVNNKHSNPNINGNAASTAEANETNMVYPTTAVQEGVEDSIPQQELNGLLDFMDPLWNWDEFFEPPLATMQGAPFMEWNFL